MRDTQRLFERTIDKLLKGVEDIDYDENELKMGIEVELEHTDDKDVATTIAKQHLAEDPAYYSKLKTIHDEDEGNTVGGGALGPAAAVGHSQSGDWYAPGDARVPQILGGIQTRRGTIGRKRRKKKKKK
jgi:hypothetical protein|tara:strand:+ start:6427 stop:6813 length:387 start_codon:yes stop_codon:yes gene_type:complete